MEKTPQESLDQGEIPIKTEFRLSDEEILKQKEEKDAQEKPQWMLDVDNKKKRPRTYNETGSTSLCPTIAVGEECPYGEGCKFSHDVRSFLDSKPADIDGVCPHYNLKGKCPYGLKCRLGGTHIKNEKNIVDEEKMKTFVDPFKNVVSKEFAGSVRKRKFVVSKPIIARIQKEKNQRQLQSLSNSKPVQNHCVAAVEAKEENLTEKDSTATGEEEKNARMDQMKEEGDDVKLRAAEKPKIDFREKLVVPALATVGNVPFRRICKQFGADVTMTEMVVTEKLLRGMVGEFSLLRRDPSEDLFGVQLMGSDVRQMSFCAEILSDSDRFSLDFIDINAACPIDLVWNRGHGAALLERPNKLGDICRAVSEVSHLPITLKLRIGKDEKNPSLHKICPRFADWGLSAVFVHGRSRQQRYTKPANWAYLADCAQSAAGVAFVGLGDVFSYPEYNSRLADFHVDAVAVGRGALYKPWLLREIKEQRHIDISSHERFEMLKDFVSTGLTVWGSDSKGVETTRRFLLEWLSFLHRYVPIGLIEKIGPHPAQKINARPPAFSGRDDLETLMASPAVTSWVKISEMLLGPIPADFQFKPKHKSTAF